jgi:glyoxylase-like metal-dependent hydrolase (beta-lactamase superfamily II)
MKTLFNTSPWLAAAVVFAGLAHAQQPNAVHLQMLPVQNNIFMLAGAGGNITVQIGKEGVLLVDSGLAQMEPYVMEEIRKLTNAPILYIINTHVHPDHVGGNEAMSGQKSVLAGDSRNNARIEGDQALKIIGHENVLNRMTTPVGKETPPLQYGLPEDEYATAFKDLRFNGEGIVIYHEPKAHTDGDSIVFFRASDVVSTGDIFTPGGYPFIDLERGGGINGEIDALDHILDLTIPGKTQEGGTYVIPGHGRLCDEADVVEFRDMVVIIRDRIRTMIGKGLTLAQVKDAKPTLDYDTEYINANSFVKADQFVEAIYKSLKESDKK